MRWKNVCLWVLSVAIELWVIILFVSTGWSHQFYPCFVLAAIFAFFGSFLIIGIWYVLFAQWFSCCGRRNNIRLMCAEDDFWTPMPAWEWGQDPLLLNMIDWNPVTGWAEYKRDERLLETVVFDVPMEDSFETASDPDAQYEVYLSKYMGLCAEALLKNETCDCADCTPIAVCIAYLLMENSNEFLFESIAYFTKIFRCPIYVMMNVRDRSSPWVTSALLQVWSRFKKYNGQVHTCFVESSQSKADNLNSFARDVLPEGLEYVAYFDIDDRPMYSEASLIRMAVRKNNMRHDGFRIVGVQGPCLDTYTPLKQTNKQSETPQQESLNTWGALECYIEYRKQWETSQGWFRIKGYHSHQGSNLILAAWVVRKYEFDPNALLEDMRWSINLASKEGATLYYCQPMVSFGQLPNGFWGIWKRRKRWTKGDVQEACHTMRSVPLSGHTYYYYSVAFLLFYSWLVSEPILYALLLFGFGVVSDACLQSTGTPFFLELQELNDGFNEAGMLDQALAIVWNYCGFSCLIFMLFITVGHEFQTHWHWHSSAFINGRRGRCATFLQHVWHCFQMWIWVIPWLGFWPHMNKVFYLEMCLELLLSKKPAWEPTIKEEDISRQPSSPIIPAKALTFRSFTAKSISFHKMSL